MQLLRGGHLLGVLRAALVTGARLQVGVAFIAGTAACLRVAASPGAGQVGDRSSQWCSPLWFRGFVKT